MQSRAMEIDPINLPDLTDLPISSALSPDDILPILRARFLEGLCYTSISSRVLVSVNPHQHVQINSDAVLADWNAEYKDCGGDGLRGQLAPHVWEMSGRAYYHMRRTGQDQTIVVEGQTASGKTETTRLLLKSLLDLGAPISGKRGTKLTAAIPAAFFLLDSFGHASTIHNTNASRFGRYSELQFSDAGRIVGLKGLEYYLEKSRVTGASAGERNFHVFYYLVAGVDAEERSYLRLDQAETFRYLSHRRSSTTSDSADALRFTQMREAFKTIGFPKKAVASILQLLAAILHLGNIDFVVDKSRNADCAVVKNPAVLDTVAEFLGVGSAALEFALTNKTMLVGRELCGMFLDPDSAAANRDDLAKSLYSMLFSWIGEFLNEKLCRDDFATFIAVVDFPGVVASSALHREGSAIDAFCFNLASERNHAFVLEQLYEASKAEYNSEGLSKSLPGLNIVYASNADSVKVLTKVPGGLVHIIDDQSRRMGKTDESMVTAMSKRWASNSSFASREGDHLNGRAASFICTHWNSQVEYSSDNFLADNSATLSPTFVDLLRGTSGAHVNAPTVGGSSYSFVRQLFTSGAIQTVAHPQSEATIVGAMPTVAPRRAPSTRRAKGRGAGAEAPEGAAIDEEDAETGKVVRSDGRSVVKDYNDSLTILFDTMATTKSWFIFCLRPNDAQLPNQVDAKLVKSQIRSLGLAELTKRLQGDWVVNLEFKEWWDRYEGVPPISSQNHLLAHLPYHDKAAKVRDIMGWKESDMGVGKIKVFLSDAAFRHLEDYLRAAEPEEQVRNLQQMVRPVNAFDTLDPYSPYLPSEATLAHYSGANDLKDSSAGLPLVERSAGAFQEDDVDYDRKTFYTDEEYGGDRTPVYDDARSLGTSEAYAPSRTLFDTRRMDEKNGARDLPEGEVVKPRKNSAGRNRWIALTWAFTWWIPSVFLSKCGGMKRSDVRMAWREKLLINMLIWLLCGTAVFVIAILGNLICPTEYVYSTSELSSASFNNDVSKMLVAIRGEAFDLSKLAPLHLPGPSVIPINKIQRYGGLDATSIFPVQVSALCNGVTGSLSPWLTLESTNTSNTYASYHDFRASTTDSRPDWYTETMIFMRYNFRKGFIGFTPSDISNMAAAGRQILVIGGSVYDMTDYVTNGGATIQVPAGQLPPTNIDRLFMSGAIVSLFQSKSGQDVTNLMTPALVGGADILARQQICLRNLFFIGKVDSRNSVQCQFSRYILLALSIVMVSIIGFKFLAALQFGASRKPEDYDKFVICQVPCYTEGEESLRNCLNSLTRLKYDDKRKLLFVICDGMIVGSGNDRPTPRIVLDILGADPSIDPEPLSFLSVGEGSKQHNMAKVYSGLYEAAGHIVPYLVVVKVGTPEERSRPGNRGKRDSQMLLMRFLNRVHFDSPMSPCELEMYHQIKNVIGVNPSFYEYLFMVDADTVVDPLSLNYLIGTFVQDRKIVGLCGETSLSNAKASWTTMMQVYEYFISHYLAKAFESLFGSVTCLPGCFSVYRVRSVDSRPLIISDEIVAEYGTNMVDTLHVKNLLSLGEDRYLTTIMMKAFPEFKMAFCKDATAQTIAPDDWKVLMSQRRRWINSTVHNLAELLFVDKMCGFCCFSMRFVVFVDLASTLIAPVTVAYIGYLIYLVAAEHKPVPTTALIMLGAIYGLQAIIYILHRKFEHIGWMIVYILAIPLFSFVLPLASFWQMDDFSWGSTREIVGERGVRVVVTDEGKFDPASIPLKSWQEFENELWEAGSNKSVGSLIAASKRDDAETQYGRDSTYAPSLGYNNPTRTASPRRSTMGRQSYGGQQSFRGNYTDYDAGSVGSRGGNSPQSGFFGAPSRSQSPGYAAMQEFGGGARPVSTAFSTATPRVQGTLPMDDVIIHDIQNILATANLQTLTKKGVRQQLESMYGTNLGDRKQLVNEAIESALGLL